MLRVVVFACIVSSAFGSGPYPIIRHTTLDPGTYNILYSTEAGPINETWAFSKRVTLTGLIVPAQINDLKKTGSYDELITARVFRYQRVPGSTTLVGQGVFKGNVAFGHDIYIPIVYGNRPPVMEVFVSNGDNTYTMEFSFGRKGFYPWYTSSRLLSTTGIVTPATDQAGYCIGVEYSLNTLGRFH